MDTYVLLDARGIVLQHLHSGKDAEATTDSLTGRPINSPGHALENIITDVLLPTFQQFRVKNVVAVWDGGNKYREILSGGTYKAQRRAREASPEMQQITKEAQQAALGLFKGLGITSVTVPSVEADDTIAWMVDRLPTNIVIHTVDRDLLALAAPRADKLVSVCVKREWPEMFVDKGVRVPLRWVTLYKSLVGDTSDNYGGVKGFGPKSWEQLVLDYGYDNLHEFEEAVNGKGFADLMAVVRAEPGQHPLIERILEGRVEWKTSWELAKFHPELVYSRDNAEKKFLLPKLVVRVPSAAKVQSVLETHGCTHLLPDLLPYLPQQLLITADGSSEAEILADAKALIAESPFVSIDWETHAPIHEPFLQAAKGRDHVDMLRSRLTGVGLTMGRNLEYTFYLSVGHKDTNNLSPSLIPQLMDLIPADKPKVIQNCLPGDVEVFTRSGWVRLDALQSSNEVMQWESDCNKLSFVTPSAYIQTKSDLLHSWEAAFHKCAYTPEHRMYIATKKSSDWSVRTAAEVSGMHPNSVYIPVAGIYESDRQSPLSADEARLLEATRADGHFPKRGNQCKFRFSKERKISRLLKLLDTVNAQYSLKWRASELKPVCCITVQVVGVMAEIRCILTHDKHYSVQWVQDLSISAREAILDEAMYWDGDKHPNSSSFYLHSVDARTVESFQLMAALSNRRCSIQWHENKKDLNSKAKLLACIRISPKNRTKLNNRPETLTKETKFDVYCISVPSGAFMVRSKGAVHMTGNCYFENAVYKSQFGKTLDNCHDTKVMASHVDESESNGLKDLSKRLLNYTQIKYRDVIEKGKGMADYSAEHVFAYGADDPLVTAHLYELLKLQLMLEGTWDFVRENEFPAIYPLVDAYLQGVEIDWVELERIRAEDAEVYEKQMTRLRELLKEHNTEEAIRAGVQNLLAYEREVIDARLKVRELTEDEAAAEIAKLHLTLEERVTYRDWVRQDKPLKIALTPKQLSETAALLGLPEIPQGEDGKYLNKRPDINAWLDQLAACQARAPREYRPWVEAVLEARSLLCSSKKDDNNPGIARIKREMEAVQRAFLPESKKYVWTGTELNMDSPPQMQALLYGMLCLPARMRSFDVSESRAELDLEGALQANKDAILTALAEDAPQGAWQREALECLWAAKRADTRRKSFYTPYPLWKHPATGRVHAQINSVGTETRRMSGSSPNLMQLPKRDEGVKFRYCFLPSKGHDLIVSIDFAGEELRVGAGLSLDPAMLGCYIDAEILKTLPDWMLTQLGPALVNRFKTAELRDLHSQTAAGIAGISYEQFEQIRHDPNHPDAKKMKAIRGTAKTVNFGSQYGIGPSKLSRQLICDTETAREYLEAKKSAYHRFEAWREEKIKELHAKGYLQTLYGSYRHVFNKLWTSDEGMVGYIERAALNFLIQGLCADYLKVVLRCIHETRVLQRHQVHLIAPIHDELVFSCSSKNAADFICEVHSIMVQGIPGLPCPIWAEPSLGPNFGEQIEIGPWPTPALVEQAIDQALNRGEVQQAA